jgi:hypothetical protein
MIESETGLDFYSLREDAVESAREGGHAGRVW